MKKLLIIATLNLVLAAARTEAQPALTSLPRGVRETAPTQVKTVKLMTFRLGARDSPVLIHVWKVAAPPARPARDTPNFYMSTPLPFCADVYVPSGKAGLWRWVNAVLWNSIEEPRSIEARWLKPKRKSGPVLLIDVSVTGSRGQQMIVATFPYGVQGQHEQQEFQGRSSSGSSTNFRFDGVDRYGLMAIHQHSSGGGGNIYIDHLWEEEKGEFVPFVRLETQYGRVLVDRRGAKGR